MSVSAHPFSRLKASALATTSSVALIVCAAMAPQAFAQQTAQAAPQTAQAPAVEEIVVTGTRIIRNGYEAPTPVSVLSADQLNAVAATNIADAVREMPVFSNAVTGRT